MSSTQPPREEKLCHFHEFTSIFGDWPGAPPTLWARAGGGPGGAVLRPGEWTAVAPLPRLPGRHCVARELQGRAGRHRSGERVWSWLGAGGLAMAAAWRGQRGSHCPGLGALATEVIPNHGMFVATPEAAHTWWGTQ